MLLESASEGKVMKRRRRRLLVVVRRRLFGRRHQKLISGVPRAFLARDLKPPNSHSISAVHFVSLAAVLIFHVGTNNEYPISIIRLMGNIGTHNNHLL